MTNGQPTAGWYPDHNDHSIVRYWDGQRWTEHTAPAQPAAHVHPASPASPAASPASPVGPAAGTAGGGNWFTRHKVASSVLGVVAAFLLVGVVGAAAGSPESDEPSAESPTTAAAAGDEPAASEDEPAVEEEPAAEKDGPAKAEAQPTEAPSPTEEPKATVEETFIAIVQKGHDAADSGNEIAVVQARKERGSAICKLLGPSLSVAGWTGTIETVETELGGDAGVMSIAISEDFAVQTWNNSFSDLGSGTLIKPNSKMYGQLAALEEGDEVSFAGRFVSDPGNCLQEQSLMDVNGMLTPDFSFRFSSVTTD